MTNIISEVGGDQQQAGGYIAGAGTLDTAVPLGDDSEDSIAVLIRDGRDLEVLEDGGDPTRGVRDLPPAEDGDLLARQDLLPRLRQAERRHEVGQLRGHSQSSG